MTPRYQVGRHPFGGYVVRRQDGDEDSPYFPVSEPSRFATYAEAQERVNQLRRDQEV